jgi:two-component system OmpR family response regulator
VEARVKALVLEDDEKLARFLSRVLTEEGFAVDSCGRGTDAIAQADGTYDVVVLDWSVPDMDGLSVCRTLRERGHASPILMLTARAETRERVLGLEAGADDYMVKPFELDELVARVRALVRRTSGYGALRCGPLVIDRVRHDVTVAGAPLALTNREYALLLHLVHRADQIVKRSDLLAHVWAMRFDPGSNLLDVHVSRLRDKLGDQAWMIQTVRGVGFRLRSHRSA